MELIRKLKRSVLDLVADKYFAVPDAISPDTGDFSFAPSAELIHELNSSFTPAEVEAHGTGLNFSAQQLNYNIGGKNGGAIYKTTITLYPGFSTPDTIEEYERSFSLND